MSEEPFESSSDRVPLDLQEVERDVFVTPFLTPEGAARVLAEVDRRGAAGAERLKKGALPPNSMHDHGVMLGSLGLDGLVDDWLGDPGVRALLAERFGDIGGASIDHHHSYLVDYGRDGDEDLGFHVDDSEVTFNLCLGESFSGAELVMLGRRCDDHRQTEVLPGETLEIEHVPGSLVIHAGRHRHRVDPILRGRRRNLIAWLRSAEYRSGGAHPRHPAWCGWSED